MKTAFFVMDFYWEKLCRLAKKPWCYALKVLLGKGFGQIL